MDVCLGLPQKKQSSLTSSSEYKWKHNYEEIALILIRFATTIFWLQIVEFG